ncbi:ABC transporter permease [Nitrococcus mobilis]|uniref:ABC transporter permease n=1 Tax=Nitrococcus mobilis Nb-231 TaxID=314278 RepID=A4BMN2_9GAMM|nr:ABC transporter permease [Nitrococcus mobilis]EAR23570.1 ABC transporter permease [Nitrococcus mobilis Nb-231]
MAKAARIIGRMLHPIGVGLLVLVGLGTWIMAPLLVLILAALGATWLVASRRGHQALAITWTGLATLPQRLGGAFVIVIGIAGVVGVLIALLAMAKGFQTTLQQAGNDDTAIVLRAGANAELSSRIDRASAILIAQAPGILHDAQNHPILSKEVVVVTNIPKRSTGTDANVEVRGVGPRVWALRPDVQIISGRRFKPGLRELVVGRGAWVQFKGLDLGSSVQINNQEWQVVGVFASGNTHESELWGDAESVAAAYRRNGFQSVTARLTSPTAIDRFKVALATDPRLKVDVETTRAYYSKQSQRLTNLIQVLGTGIATIMGFGATFGALNTMYAAVAARAREIATLRALGFTGLPLVTALLLETMLLALLGGVLGAGIAYGLFNGYTVSTLGSNFSQVVFQFQVSTSLLLNGLQWALAIGFLGGLFPALRAAALPLTVALREL